MCEGCVSCVREAMHGMEMLIHVQAPPCGVRWWLKGRQFYMGQRAAPLGAL